MARITPKEVLTVFTVSLLLNLLFASFLYTWVTENDIENLPKEPLDRFLTLFFIAITSFTTIGFGEYGNVMIKSKKIKLIITFYILLAISGVASFFFDF